MADQAIALVLSKAHHIFVSTEGEEHDFAKPAQAFRWLREQRNGSPVVAIMGGPGQEFLIRVQELGIPVHRVPLFQLQASAGLEPKDTAQDQAKALQLLWASSPEKFYELGELDPAITLVRELTRQRLNIQESRKRATLQLHAALRSLEYVLPEEAADLVELLRKGLKDMFTKPKLRERIEAEFQRLETVAGLTSNQQARIFGIRRVFSNPRFVLGAKEDEQELEKQILRLLWDVPIWQYLKSRDSVLPAVKGLGPAIGGALVAEIYDIRRFPTPAALRAYARFHVSQEGGFPHRKVGELSAWNRYLNRAVWLWSADQMPRWDNHPWRVLYLWKKAREMQVHPEPVPREVKTKAGHKRTVHDFTLKHLDSRAKRWVGSKFLEYVWDLWQEVAQGRDPEAWYLQSAWPVYFAEAESALAEGLREYLETEIPKRKRSDPKEEVEEAKDEE